MEIASFTAWVNSVRGPTKVIGIHGISATSGPRIRELSDFMTSVLHIEGTPGHWRCRRIGFLEKRCGHRLTEEGAVRSMAEKACETRENFSPAEMQRDHITPKVGDVGLQEALPIVMMSEAQGYKSNLQAHSQSRCKLFSLSYPQSRCNNHFLYSSSAQFVLPFLQTMEVPRNYHLSSERH